MFGTASFIEYLGVTHELSDWETGTQLWFIRLVRHYMATRGNSSKNIEGNVQILTMEKKWKPWESKLWFCISVFSVSLSVCLSVSLPPSPPPSILTYLQRDTLTGIHDNI